MRDESLIMFGGRLGMYFDDWIMFVIIFSCECVNEESKYSSKSLVNTYYNVYYIIHFQLKQMWQFMFLLQVTILFLSWKVILWNILLCKLIWN